MSNALTVAKRGLTWSVVITTILSSLGASALLPLAANAAVCSDVHAGDRFKLPGNPAVYILNANMERHYFERADSYATWFGRLDAGNVLRPDYSGILEVPQSCIANFPRPALPPYGVNYRPGSLVQFPTSNSVYIVQAGNKLVKIADPAAAVKLFGANWATKIHGVSDVFESNYTVVAGENTGTPVPGMLVREGANGAPYMVGDDGKLWSIDGGIPAFLTSYVASISSADFASLQMGGSIARSAVTANPTQGSGGSSSVPSPVPAPGVGALSVSLNQALTPAAVVVPQGATHVPYTRVTLRAGSAAVHVTGMTLERVGQGSSSNFSKVWIEGAAGALSNDQSVNSDNTLTLSPDFTVPANSSMDVWVVANLSSANTATQDAFRITGITTDGNASVTGLPVTGNEMSYSGYSIGTVTMDDRGADDEVEVGDNGAIIGEFELTFESVSDQTGMFDYLRLRNEGTSDLSDFSNIALYESGIKVSERTEIWGKYATFFVKSDMRDIRDGQTRRFEVRADIVSGDDDDTVILALKDDRDLSVKETLSGGKSYGAIIDSSSLPSTKRLKTYTFDAGQMTVSLDPSNPSNNTYAKNTNDVVAIVGRADFGQPIRVEGLSIKFHTDSTVTNGSGSNELTKINNDIERAKLYVNDRLISTLSAAEAVTSATNDNDVATDEYHYDFDSTFEIRDNDLIKLVVDIDTDAATNTYKFTFDSDDFDSPEYVRSGETVASGNKSGTVTGNRVEILAANATFTRNDGYSSGETFVAGAQGVKLMNMLVTAGNSSLVRIRTLNFDTNFSSSYLSSNYTRYTNCNVRANGAATALSNRTTDLSAAGVISLTGLDLTVPQNGQAQLALFCDIQTGATATSGVVVTFDASDSTIEDAEGDTVSTISDVNSASLTIAASGSLTVSIDGDTADSDLLVAGQSTAVNLATWRFEADNDGVEITDLYVGNNSTSTVSTTTLETDADFLVNQYELVVDGQVVDTRAPSAGAVHFDLTGKAILVGKDMVKRATVRAVFNNITQASQSGKQIALALYAITAESAGPGTELGTSSITGVGFTTDTTQGLSSAPTGDLMVVHKAVPSLAAVALGSSVLSNGDKDIFKFSVTANSGDIGWANVTLSVSGACTGGTTIASCLGATTTMTLKDQANQTVPATFSTGTGQLLIQLTSPKTVSVGQTQTYTVNATLVGFTGDNDSLSIRIRDNATRHLDGATLADARTAATAYSGPFVWSDYSGTSESTTDAQWFIGKDVRGLDTASLELRR